MGRPSQAGHLNHNFKNAGWHTCLTCEKAFHSYSKTIKYCSLSCRSKRPANLAQCAEMAKRPRVSTKGVKRMPPNTACGKCGKAFRIKPSHLKDEHYCSRSCLKEARKRTPNLCIVCSQEHYGRGKTCSVKCYGDMVAERQRGSNSHRWQGGKTSEAMKLRNSREYAAWREAVFARDNYTCQECGSHGGKLNADHIKPFSTHPELRLDVSNGRTLCFTCHTKTETWGYGARRLLEQQCAA